MFFNLKFYLIAIICIFSANEHCQFFDLLFLPGVLEYYHASLEPIVQYSSLRTDVFQGFREIGNAILFCLQLEGFLVSYCGQSLTDVSVKIYKNGMSRQPVAFKIRLCARYPSYFDCVQNHL